MKEKPLKKAAFAGTMLIQGREVTLDSFYISRFVLNNYWHFTAHNWAYDNALLRDGWYRLTGPVNPSGQATNVLLGWMWAIAVSNWFSL